MLRTPINFRKICDLSPLLKDRLLDANNQIWQSNYCITNIIKKLPFNICDVKFKATKAQSTFVFPIAYRPQNPTNFLDMDLIFIYQNKQQDKHVTSHMFNLYSSLSHMPFLFFPHLISSFLSSLSLVCQIANSSLKGCVSSTCKFPFSAVLNEIQLMFLLLKSVIKEPKNSGKQSCIVT